MRARRNDDGAAHAPLPPSASSRWLKCPPSQGYIRSLIERKVIVKRKSGPSAERGTRIHHLGDQLARSLLAGGKVKRVKDAAEDEYDEALVYAQYVTKKRDDLEQLYGPTEVGLEDRAVLVADMCWGSRDAWIAAGSHLCVIDLKTGREPVDPEGNTQTIIYAADLIKKFKPRTIELCIWQPNANDGYESERSYTYEIDEFMAVLEEICLGVERAAVWFDKDDGYDAHLSPGDHCRYCDALGVCPAARGRSLAISSTEFTPVAIENVPVLPESSILSPDQLAQIMRRAPEFRTWLDAVEVRALELASRGDEVPGFKVVERITHRVFKAECTDAQIARGVGLKAADIVKTSRLPLTQIEKKLDATGKEKLKQFIIKPQGLPTIVADSDRRVPMLATKINFTPLTNEENDNG